MPEEVGEQEKLHTSTVGRLPATNSSESSEILLTRVDGLGRDYIFTTRTRFQPTSSSGTDHTPHAPDLAIAEPSGGSAPELPEDETSIHLSAGAIPDFAESELPDLIFVSDSECEGNSECSWDGGVNHVVSDSEDEWKATENSGSDGLGSD
ncbi:hypothetical protein B0H10DRAFT_2441334 [Mycena sp. CBHHK59/15]|nr:hypothetical protein B0H10DRAFT_2441334 [Mycena sp. CBHHK59/15]